MKGSVLDDLNRLEEAVQEYAEAIKLNTSDPRFYKNKGIIEQKLERFDDALISFEAAYKLGDASSAAAIGRLHYQKKNYKEALQKFEEVLAKDPSNFSCLLYKANVFKDEKKFAEAQKIYDELSKA